MCWVSRWNCAIKFCHEISILEVWLQEVEVMLEFERCNLHFVKYLSRNDEGDRAYSCKISYCQPKWIRFRLVSRFYKSSMSGLGILHADALGNINSSNAVQFHCEAPQIRCCSNCKCCRVTAIQTACTERKVKVPGCKWKKLNNKEHRLKVQRSFYRPGQFLRFRGFWSFQILGLSAREGVKVFSRIHRPYLLSINYSWYSLLSEPKSTPEGGTFCCWHIDIQERKSLY